MHGKTYTNYSLCAKCGGKCCQQMAGAYHPEDIKNLSEQTVFDLLQAGRHAIDWYEGDPRIDWLDVDRTMPENPFSTVYYLRPRHVGKPAIEGAHRGTPCINWNKQTGCQLKQEQRPLECRALVPQVDSHGSPVCTTHKKDKADKRSISIAWIPYQEMIKNAQSKYKEKCNQQQQMQST